MDSGAGLINGSDNLFNDLDRGLWNAAALVAAWPSGSCDRTESGRRGFGNSGRILGYDSLRPAICWSTMADSQVIELLGRNRLIDELLRAGLEVALPRRDRGIDLIAYAEIVSDVPAFVGRPIQLKAASG